jgi:hypothetical protein
MVAPMGGPVHPGAGQAMPQMGAQWVPEQPQQGPPSSIRPVGGHGGPPMGVGGMPGGGMGGVGPMMMMMPPQAPPSSTGTGNVTPSGMATPVMNPDSAQPSPGMRQNAFRGNGFAGQGQGQMGVMGAG